MEAPGTWGSDTAPTSCKPGWLPYLRTSSDRDGTPKLRSEAAKLAGEIQKLKDLPSANRLEDARKAARWARIELDRFIGANVAALADESKGRQAGDDLRAQVNALLEAIGSYQATVAYFSALVSKAPGLEPQVEMPGALPDRLTNLGRELKNLLPEIRDPLPRSRLPATGAKPHHGSKARTAVGSAFNTPTSKRSGRRRSKLRRQRERLARRDVSVRPPQSQSVGRGRLEETLDALLGDQ